MPARTRRLLLIRSISLLALYGPLLWIAHTYTVIPLLIGLGVSAALYSIRIGQHREGRYGRRIPVTEMLAEGRRAEDRAMILAGLAGYAMLLCFLLAALAAWSDTPIRLTLP